MKHFLTVFASMLISISCLSAEQASTVSTQATTGKCPCGLNCKCTPENHCGCMSKDGKPASKQYACGREGCGPECPCKGRNK